MSANAKKTDKKSFLKFAIVVAIVAAFLIAGVHSQLKVGLLYSLTHMCTLD